MSLRAALGVVVIGATALLVVTGCTSGSTRPPAPASASQSPAPSNSAYLPLPPGVVKDSIEDVNSTKDMTGVVSTIGDGDDNPYIKLIPYVCPFLPDSVTRGQLGMSKIINGFGGQHTLLNLCTMINERNPDTGASLAISVTIQATSFNEVSSSPTHTNVSSNIPVWRDVMGLAYKNAGDDSTSADGRHTKRVCNLAWGTFYGTAVVAIFSSDGFLPDPCAKAIEVSRIVAPYLPSKPIQMRASEG